MDVRVRQALSIAINREGIRRQIMEGFSLPTGQAMPEGAMGYDPSIKVPAYDPEAAQQAAGRGRLPRWLRHHPARAERPLRER